MKQNLTRPQLECTEVDVPWSTRVAAIASRLARPRRCRRSLLRMLGAAVACLPAGPERKDPAGTESVFTSGHEWNQLQSRNLVETEMCLHRGHEAHTSRHACAAASQLTSAED